MSRLVIITTHPIQYYAPVFKLLHERRRVEIKVFFTWGEAVLNKYDPGFDKTIAWDVPVLEGYPYEWVKNTAKDPGTHHFMGIVNPGLTAQVNAWQPDAVLIYGWGFHSHLKALRYFKGTIPVLFRGDSTLLDDKKGIRSILKTLWLKYVYRHADHALYVGANNKAYFKKYGLKDTQLSFAPHAVDNERFASARNAEAASIRAKLNIGDAELLILFAGKLEEKKAPVELLDAFIKMNTPNVHLLVAGSGPLEAQLKAKAGNNTRVHFIGFQNQSQMPALYRACDIFCLPSKGPGETWGLAVNEAMAAGKAVLVSDKVGSAVDLVVPGRNGFIFKSGSEDDLSGKLDTLLKAGKNSLAKMGEHSKEIIKDWSFEKQAEAIEAMVINDD